MRKLIIVFSGLIGAVLSFLVVVRIVRKLHPFPFPFGASWILENPMRKYFMGANRTLDWIGIGKGMRVLEVGSGTGFFTVEAAKRVGNSGKLYCLDINPRMIAKAREKSHQYGLDNVELIVGDATALPFAGGSFDMAFLALVLGEIPDKKGTLHELHRVLRSGGILSVTEWFGDPDYCLRRTVASYGGQIGFELSQKRGNFFYYTLSFQRPY